MWWPAPAVAAAVLVGCGGGGDDGGADSTPGGGLPESGPLSVPTDESLAGALDDGHVAPAEYERAFFAYVACLDENGVPHDEPVLRELRDPPRWNVDIGPYRQDQEDEVDQLVRNCRGRFLSSIELAWEEQEGPSEAERQARDQRVADCFNEQTGLEVEDFDALFRLRAEGGFTAEQRHAQIYCTIFILEGYDPFAQ